MEFKNSTEGAVFRVLRNAPPSHYLLNMQSFSSLNNLNKFISDNFDAGDFKWYVILFPNRHNEGKGKNISIYLSYDWSFNAKLFVNFILPVKNQRTGPHIEKKG
ncbi:hypothetical protein Patl1_19242 [Pistacia atlantica]|uniref:Uncharacterized protein n=1 Tax=Pistacia atlantica TaxID=434234 RepID=A0ACC1BYR0_9ROSI|nr:hypothetical protein Patl1_19242 [Pistacia atlantica]